MKFTINTDNKTIEIHGSFKFEELEIVKNLLPKEWRDFEIGLAEPKQLMLLPKTRPLDGTWDEAIPYTPQPLLPNPPYPIIPYKVDCCGNCTVCPYKTVYSVINGKFTSGLSPSNTP